MTVAGVREFRNRATALLGGKDIVFVTKHGKLASIVVPVGKPLALPVELRRELLTQMGGAIAVHLARTGVGERKILSDFAAWRKDRRKTRR